MNNKLMYLLPCLLIMFMFIGEAILPVYADDGQHHNNHGDVGPGFGGNGPNHNPLDDNRPIGKPWQNSENMTQRITSS